MIGTLAAPSSMTSRDRASPAAAVRLSHGSRGACPKSNQINNNNNSRGLGNSGRRHALHINVPTRLGLYYTAAFLVETDSRRFQRHEMMHGAGVSAHVFYVRVRRLVFWWTEFSSLTSGGRNQRSVGSLLAAARKSPPKPFLRTRLR